MEEPVAENALLSCWYDPRATQEMSLASPWCSEIVITCVCAYSVYPTLCDPLDCSPPGSSVQGISQARILQSVAISSSNGVFLIQGSHLHPLSSALQADCLPTEQIQTIMFLLKTTQSSTQPVLDLSTTVCQLSIKQGGIFHRKICFCPHPPHTHHSLIQYNPVSLRLLFHGKLHSVKRGCVSNQSGSGRHFVSQCEKNVNFCPQKCLPPKQHFWSIADLQCYVSFGVCKRVSLYI